MKIAILTLFFFLNSIVFSQAPEGFNYQAVVRTNNGEVISNQVVAIKVSILKNSSSGFTVYSERHSVATNDYGLITLSIGNGNKLSGQFNTLEWGKDLYFIKTELDVSGGTNYELIGISQLLSVPYALHAKTAENIDDADPDPVNEIQTLSQSGSSVILSRNGGSISINDNDADSINEIQTLSIVGNQLEISKGNSVILTGAIDLDADPTNELQVLSISNDTVYLTDGGYAILPHDADADSTNEIQSLSIIGDSLEISKGNKVAFLDNDSTNELQLLSVSNDTLFLSKGNYVILPADFDSDSTNEIQSLSLIGDTLSLSNGGGNVILADNDSTNELQEVKLTKDSLTLTKGTGISLKSLKNNMSGGNSGSYIINKFDLKLNNLKRIGWLNEKDKTYYNSLYQPMKSVALDNGNIVVSMGASSTYTFYYPFDSIPKKTTSGLASEIYCINTSGNVVWKLEFDSPSGGLNIKDVKQFNNETFLLIRNTGANLGIGAFSISNGAYAIIKVDSAGKIVAVKEFTNYSSFSSNTFEIDENGFIYYLSSNDGLYCNIYQQSNDLSSNILTNYFYTGRIYSLNSVLIGKTKIALGFSGSNPNLTIVLDKVSFNKEANGPAISNPTTFFNDQICSIYHSLIISYLPSGTLKWQQNYNASVTEIDIKTINDTLFFSLSGLDIGKQMFLDQVVPEIINQNSLVVFKIYGEGKVADFRVIGNGRNFYGGKILSEKNKVLILFIAENEFFSDKNLYDAGVYVGEIFNN